MADNTTLNSGTGGDVIATDDISGVKYQRVKVCQGADGSAADVSSAAPLQVTLANTGANTNKLLTTPDLPSGAATSAKQDTLIAQTDGIEASLTSIDGKTPALSGGRVPVDGSGVTQPVSGTVTANAGSGTLDTSVADGSDVAQGAIADASVAAGATGSISAKLRRISADIGALVTGTVLAAGSALIGKIISHFETGTIYNGTTALTPKFAKVTLSATGEIVAAVTSKKIRVLRYSAMADAACTFSLKSHTTGQISGTKYIAANGGAGGSFCPLGHCETVSGEALDLTITGTANVSIDVTYIEV